jgi:glucose/arabinose dehydrogenase
MTRFIATGFIILLLSSGKCNKSVTDNPPPPPPPPPPSSVQLEARTLTQGLQFPWELVFGSDGKLWMTERGGRISRVDTASGAITPLLTITEVVANNEGGLLGMVLHPDFTNTPHVFVAYNYNNAGNYREKIVRYTFSGSTLINPVTILDNIAAASIHNGCRLVISTDNKLIFSTGDAANTALPQDSTKLNGKILRLNLDGSIPTDNPFPNNAVWSRGHRNAQGLVLANGKLFSSEHGPSNDDEVNLIEKGRNYGWPDVQGYCNTPAEQSFCTSRNVAEPLMAWTPTLAVCGMDYYNNNAIPQWKNSLLLTTLKASRLVQLYLNSSQTAIDSAKEFYTNTYGRLRDVCVSPDGKVYICTSNGSNADRIVEIRGKR